MSYRGSSYSSHFECITEEQKYGGKNFKQQEFKGKNKQNAWVAKVKTMIQSNQYSPGVQNVLKSLINYDNIPRKKVKFINFIKNSIRIRDEKLIEQIWQVFESAIKEEKEQNTKENEQEKPASFQNGVKRKVEKEVQKEEEPSKKLKESEYEEESNVSLKMKNVLKTFLVEKGTMKLKKLRKKVLNLYNEHGYTNDNDVLTKFDKVINKKCFTLEDNMISYSKAN